MYMFVLGTSRFITLLFVSKNKISLKLTFLLSVLHVMWTFLPSLNSVDAHSQAGPNLIHLIEIGNGLFRIGVGDFW